MQKLAILTIAILAASLIMATSLSVAEAKGKPVKPLQCKAPVKIQLGIKGLDGTANQTLMGVVTLNGVSKSKNTVTEANETFTVMNFLFKKMTPCPAVGDAYSGFVNGTEFSGTLTSIKKPNRASVDIS